MTKILANVLRAEDWREKLKPEVMHYFDLAASMAALFTVRYKPVTAVNLDELDE